MTASDVAVAQDAQVSAPVAENVSPVADAAPDMTETLAAELQALRVGQGEEVTPEMEFKAKQELVQIHPSVRAAITKELPPGLWVSLNIVEKLALIKMKQAFVSEEVREQASLEFYKQSLENRPVADPFKKPEERGPNGEKLCPMTGKPITDDQKCPWTLMFEEMAKKDGDAPAKAPTFTTEELAKHNKPEDAWISFEGRVFDITKFLPEHPGGRFILHKWLGKDASELGANLGKQHTGHEARVQEALAKHFIGNLKDGKAECCVM